MAPVVSAQVTDTVSCKPVAFGFLHAAATFPGVGHTSALPGTQPVSKPPHAAFPSAWTQTFLQSRVLSPEPAYRTQCRKPPTPQTQLHAPLGLPFQGLLLPQSANPNVPCEFSSHSV